MSCTIKIPVTNRIVSLLAPRFDERLTRIGRQPEEQQVQLVVEDRARS